MKKLVFAIVLVLLAGCQDKGYIKVATTTVETAEKSEFVNRMMQISGQFAVFSNPYLSNAVENKPSLCCMDLISGRLLWSKDISPKLRARFVVSGDSVFALVDSKLARINLTTGDQAFLSEEKFEELAGSDEKSVYCTKSKQVSESKFDFNCYSFGLQLGKLNWNSKIDMNYGWLFPGKDTITVFTSNTVDKKFAILDSTTGEVLRYEPISSRNYLVNLDNPSDIVYFDNNALNLSTREKTIKLIDYKDLPDWAGVSGFYAKEGLFVYRKNHELQKIVQASGEPVFSLESKDNGYFKTDGVNSHLIGINDKSFNLISMSNGKTDAQYDLEKPIKSYTLTDDDFVLLLNPNKVVLLDRKNLVIRKEIETDKTIKNLVGSNAGTFGIIFDDGEMTIYSRSSVANTP